jgi:hypothetical protein
MTSMQQAARPASAMPGTVIGAIALSLAHAAFGLIAISVIPDVEDRGQYIVINAVIAAILVAGAAAIWSGIRKATFAAIGFNALFFLMAVPEVFATDPEGLKYFAAVVLVLAGTTLALLFTPAARDHRAKR